MGISFEFFTHMNIKNPQALKVVQVGVGNFGAFRRERIRETGLFEIIAAYDVNPDALARCELEDGAKPVASFEALLEVPGAEAMIICTGAKFHAEQAIKAMDRGLHVFVEKPLCATKEEAAAILDTQKKMDRIVAVGHTDHKNSAVSKTMKYLIDSGELGLVVSFEATTAHGGGWGIKLGDWRGDPEKNPGGMLFQCGVHILHELMFYFGPITEVFSTMRYDLHSTRTADVALCHLKFTSGLIGSLNAYHVTPYRHTFSIFGTKASLYRDERYFDEGTQLQLQRRDAVGGKEVRQTVAVCGEDDACESLRSFYRAVREGGEPYPSLRDGMRAVEVVFAAEESVLIKRPVRIPQME